MNMIHSEQGMINEVEFQNSIIPIKLELSSAHYSNCWGR